MAARVARPSVTVDRRRFTPNPSVTALLDLNWRRRGSQHQNVNVDLRKNPRLASLIARFFSVMNDRDELARFVAEQADVLVEFGLLVPTNDAPEEVPPDPRLAPSLLRLVPDRHRLAFRKARRAGRQFVFDAKHVFFQRGDERPRVPWRGLPPAKAFPRGRGILWVYDPGVRSWSFYRLSQEERSLASALRRGDRRPEDLAPALLETLAHARVLVTEDHHGDRSALWSTLSADVLQPHRVGHAIARDVLPPLIVAHLRDYSRRLHREGYFYTDELQVRDDLREYRRADPLVAFFHRQGGDLVRHMTGDALFPSWQLLSRYRPGAELKEHRDRDQCAWNGSLALDTEADGAPTKPWPLDVESNGVRSRIALEPGDLALYRGTESPHSRPKLEKGRVETIMLWFFVHVSFKGDALE